MRRLAAISIVAVLAAVAAGCGGGSGGGGSTSTAAKNTCAKDQLNLVTPGKLTIGSGNPAYPPWYEGGESKGSPFKVDDPANGQGYESAVAYAIASKLGFSRDQVQWPVAFNLTFKPGPKNFDFAMQQISYNQQRAQAVDFSDSYYDVNQALVALKDKPIADTSSISDLTSAQARCGRGDDELPVHHRQHRAQGPAARLRHDWMRTSTALKNGQIDGLVTDFPTAYYIANVQLSNARLVGPFPDRRVAGVLRLDVRESATRSSAA